MEPMQHLMEHMPYTHTQIALGILELHSGCHGKNCYQVEYSKSTLMPKKLLSIAQPDGCTLTKKAIETIHLQLSV